MNDHFPTEPWIPSAAFMAFLDTLPRTAAYDAKLRAQRKREEEAEEAEALRRADDAYFREIERIQRGEQHPDDQPKKKRGWNSTNKIKHVVKGRLHLIEDDDEKGRTGYMERNRFTFEGEGSDV